MPKQQHSGNSGRTYSKKMIFAGVVILLIILVIGFLKWKRGAVFHSKNPPPQERQKNLPVAKKPNQKKRGLSQSDSIRILWEKIKILEKTERHGTISKHRRYSIPRYKPAPGYECSCPTFYQRLP